MLDSADERTAPVRAADRCPGWTLGGRYRVVGTLGHGGTAEVLRAHDELLDRDVAVKLFRTLPDPEPSGAARRELELESLAGLSHPNLIRLLDGSIGPGSPAYLVLELVPGPDLGTRLHAGPLPEHEVRAIGAQVADALAYAHERGLVHRDVKPANILLGMDGTDGMVRARLSDFGTVRMLDRAGLTATDLTVGTAYYIAPEQARGDDVSPAADVYSLGLVLIEALTGARCFDGAPHEALAARLARSPSVPAGLPAPWPALLARMTALEPAERPAAAEVASVLRPLTVPQPIEPQPVEPQPVEAQPVAPSPVMLPVAAAEPDDPDLAYPVGAEAGRRRSSRAGTAMLFVLAAVAVAALLAGAAYFAFGSAHGTPDGTAPVPIGRDSGSATPHRAHVSHGGQVGVARTAARHSSPARPTSSARAAKPTQAAVVATSSARGSTAAASPTASVSSSPTPTASADGTASPTNTPSSPAPVTS